MCIVLYKFPETVRIVELRKKVKTKVRLENGEVKSIKEYGKTLNVLKIVVSLQRNFTLLSTKGNVELERKKLCKIYEYSSIQIS